MRRGLFLLWLWMIAASGAIDALAQALTPLKPGSDFQPVEMRRLQADDFANPGMLWVSQG